MEGGGAYMNGYDEFSSTVSLAKQLLMECQDSGEIKLSKQTVKLICESLVFQWSGKQQQTMSQFKKAN